VPELIGKTLSAARQTIEAHNCFVGRIEHVRSGTVESGHVIGQSLRPGRHRVPGTKVNLEVSGGA
jgi:beta-lactam-binding protein with PASTA domain